MLSVIAIACRTVTAQTTINPDVSVIGDFRAFSHNDHSREAEVREITLGNPEMEINITGYVNPYAYAVGILSAAEGEPAEIEELYLTVNRGLPLNFGVRVGKNLLPFGRLNPVHEHAWSFLKRPLPHELFFTEEGLNDIAVVASHLLPTGEAYTELSAGILRGEGLFGAEELDALPAVPDAGFFSRLTTSFAVSESTELALGVSAVNLVSQMDSVPAIDPDQRRSWIVGFDGKLKHHPSRYRALQIEWEGLLRSDDTPTGRLTSYAGYGYIDYRFRQRYNLGLIGEYVRRELPGDPSVGTTESTNSIWRSGLYIGFSPVEETSLVRIAGHFTQPENERGFWEVTAQLVFSLGPHKPHNF